MKQKGTRTWKSQDLQAVSPLSWCRICGGELYRGMKQDGYCPQCRRRQLKKEAKK